MSRFLIGLIICLLVVSACQTPEPPEPVNPQPLEPSSVVATLVPFRREAWSYWPAATKPLAVYATVLKDNVLWVGTPSGVWRVDARTNEYVAYDDLGEIKLLLPSENGRVWAAGNNSLFYFDGQRWSLVDLPGLVDNWSSYRLLALDPQGNLWLNVDRTFYFLFAGHAPTADGTLVAERIESMPSSESDQCQTWTALATGDYSYASEAECQDLARLRQRGGPRDNSVLDLEDQAWWFKGRTLYQLKGEQLAELPWPVDLMSITPDAVEGIWLGTEEGLVRIDRGGPHSISLGREDYQLHSRPRNLAVDLAGNIWVVTADGVQKLPNGGRQWETITDFGLDARRNAWPFGTIAPAREGGIWATHGTDLWRFGGPAVMLPVDAPLRGTAPRYRSCRLIRLSVDQAGNVWSPAPGCGALQYIPETNQWMRYEPESAIDEVLSDVTGTIYLRGQAGPYTSGPVTSSSVISFTYWPLLAAHSARELNLVFAMNAQEEGYWKSSLDTGDLLFYRRYSADVFKSPLQARSLNRVHVDQTGKIWAGSVAELIMFNGQTWQHIATPSLGAIRDITSDAAGRILLAGDDGIAIYDPAADQQP